MQTHGINANKPYDVFDLLLTYVLEVRVNLAFNFSVNLSRDQNAARVGQSFQTGGNIYAFTVDVATRLNDHIAKIKSDP